MKANANILFLLALFLSSAQVAPDNTNPPVLSEHDLLYEHLEVFLLDPSKCYNTCKSCWDVTSGIYCWECKAGALWDDGACKFMDNRDVPGFGRPCIECDPGNHVNEVDYSCHPCPYSCKDCDETSCTVCKTELGFTLHDGMCLCGNHTTFHNGRCMCGDSTYLNEDGECVECKFDTRMKRGCDKCPDGYYDIKNEDGTDSCGKCHYSCGTCQGSTEYDCLTCNAGKLFEFVNEGTSKICLCVCNAKEISNNCVCEDNFSEVDGQCKAIEK